MLIVMGDWNVRPRVGSGTWTQSDMEYYNIIYLGYHGVGRMNEKMLTIITSRDVWYTVVLLIKAPQKIIHSWHQSIRQQSEFICALMGKIARWRMY